MRPIALGVILLSSSALAQLQPGRPGAEQGLWLPWSVNVSGYPQFAVSAADRKIWATQLATIAAVVKASPACNDLRGLYPEITGTLNMYNSAPASESQWKYAPLGGTLVVAVWTEKQVDRSGNAVTVRKEWRYNGPASLVISINIPVEPNAEPWMQDEQGRFFPLKESPPIGNFAVQFDNLVVARADKPPLYVAITKERLIKAWIRRIEPTARTVPDYRRQLDEAKAELARLSDAERRAPAWRKLRGSALGLIAAGTPDAAPLVEVNRAFFDPKLPRTAVQLILVRTDPHSSQRAAGSKLLSAVASMAVIEQTDWRKAPLR